MTDIVSSLGSPILLGILLGGMYAVAGIGLSLVFGVMKLINLAFGDMIVLASYLGYVFLSVLGLDPIIGLLLLIPAMFAIGLIIYRFLVNRVFKINVEAPLVLTFGISIILQNIFLIIWSPYSKGLNTSYSLSSFGVGSFVVPVIYLFDLIAGVLSMLFLVYFLRKSYLGLAIRTASQDSKMALLLGINTDRVFALTFAISMAFAAIAGVFLGMTLPFTPVSGSSYLLIAFGVVIIGGLGSIFGTFVGGLILGLSQTLGGTFFGVGYQLLVSYVIILAIMSIRPEGLFGRSGRR